jgi:preprotein translocase subunit SecG
MRISAFCAVLWLACATALTVPNAEKIEKKLAKRDDLPPKYWREAE